ncbi:methyl-accepting chemotaxis protein [Thalassotalea sp. G2M2-11]|uniref:methyl-accepting chemotaxis protein n=1 Tax=Thalassotalea sp. G2M2-11 TaxID=2787627 RepID=UPI0019CFF89E
MRVSSFSRGSVVAIAIFALVFVFTMYQVGNSLTQSRQQYSEYQALKSLATVKFNRTIAQYLQTGDASLLNQAQSLLKKIIDHSKRLGIASVSHDISQQAVQLTQDIENKYRAMGKLSGNPFALLINGEQAMSTINHQLSQYALQSAALSQQQQLDYLKLTNNIAKVIADLVTSREALFSQTQANQQSIKRYIDELKQHMQLLNNYPALAIFDELNDDDDFFADEDEPEDLASDALNELTTLVKRYLSEFDTTLLLQQQQQNGLTMLATQVEQLEQSIIKGEATIISQQAQVNKRLTLIVIGLLAFLILFLATNYWLMRSVVLNPLRKLRDSFVTLVNEGRVDQITGIALKTELGEISQSFNQMVSQLANDDKQKSTQLTLVSSAMKTMEDQAKNILNSSFSTNKHLSAVDETIQALSKVTDEVNTLSYQVVENAQATQTAMRESQGNVSEVLKASEKTNLAACAGKEAIHSLAESVKSVGTIVDVISSIAEQTNLLALNAAIEAARAGQHGRGFSVVADEVRQLAGKTQESLNQVSDRLAQLNQASDTLQSCINGIEQASAQQKHIAQLLRDNAETVVNQAVTSANVAESTLAQVNQQRQHFIEFEQAMTSVNSEIAQSGQLADTISKDVSAQVKDISQTLKLVAS